MRAIYQRRQWSYSEEKGHALSTVGPNGQARGGLSTGSGRGWRHHGEFENECFARASWSTEHHLQVDSFVKFGGFSSVAAHILLLVVDFREALALHRVKMSKVPNLKTVVVGWFEHI